MDRRHLIAGLAVLPLAACAGRTIPIPTSSDEVFADIDAAIASADALVSFVEGLGIVGPETIAGARGLIQKARDYEAQARAALGTGAWKDLTDLALRVLTGIVFAGVFVPAAPGETPTPAITMSLRK